MKILHVSSALSWRGGEQQIAWLIEELQAKGIEQGVFCPIGKPLADWVKQQGLPCHEYQKKGSISWSTSQQLARIGNQYDIVHLHDSHAHSYAVMAASFFSLRAPLILNRRVDFPIGSNWLSRWKYNHPAIKSIICVSEFIRQLVLPKIKDSTKVITIHSGIAMDQQIKGGDASLHQLLNIAPATPIVGNVAALAPHKDHLTFVEACAIIHEQNETAEFVVLGGDAGEEEKVRELIKAKGLTHKIHLLGFRKDARCLLQDFSVFMFSSKTEGLGTSVLDAASAGLAIASTNAGGIPEIIQHKENGLLCPVQDAEGLAAATLQLLDNSELAAKLGAQAKKSVQKFSKKETARKVLAVYEKIKS